MEKFKNLNFQKMVPNVVPGTPFRTPPGTPIGSNVLSVPKLVNLGSFATNFGDEIIESFNFQKMVPNVVPGTPFRTPPGTPTGPNVFLTPKLVNLGSSASATNFDDEIIKNRNFQKNGPKWGPWDPF